MCLEEHFSGFGRPWEQVGISMDFWTLPGTRLGTVYLWVDG